MPCTSRCSLIVHIMKLSWHTRLCRRACMRPPCWLQPLTGMLAGALARQSHPYPDNKGSNCVERMQTQQTCPTFICFLCLPMPTQSTLQRSVRRATLQKSLQAVQSSGQVHVFDLSPVEICSCEAYDGRCDTYVINLQVCKVGIFALLSKERPLSADSLHIYRLSVCDQYTLSTGLQKRSISFST